ncbi:zinc-ribbon domain-containing protein [candidate division WOR-3 bacterium]|nr:zinc-ribbon domain-containing protein [candidate division WOR-3 bacterium]
MIVECPKCKKKYRVRDGDVPVGGAPVQCPSCGNIFTIYREPLNIHLEPVEEVAPSAPPTYEKPAPSFEASTPPSQPAQAETPGARESFLEGIEKPAGMGVQEQPAFKQPAKPTFQQQPPPSRQPSPPPSSTAEAAARLKAALGLGGMDDFPADWPEEKKQKHRHAKRLARSLAKDLLLYHKDKIEQGLRDGNLKQLLGEEIKKSWDFYKKNVDPEVLQTTNYFKDALNDIIGKGRKIFI